MGSSNFLCGQRRALVCLTFLITMLLCSFTINVTEGSVGQTRSGLSSTATPAATPPSECSSLLVLSRCPAHSFSTMSCPCLCGHRNHDTHNHSGRRQKASLLLCRSTLLSPHLDAIVSVGQNVYHLQLQYTSFQLTYTISIKLSRQECIQKGLCT